MYMYQSLITPLNPPGIVVTAFVRVRALQLFTSDIVYLLDCVDRFDAKSTMRLYYSYPDQDFKFYVKYEGETPFEVSFAESGQLMGTDDWQFVSLRLDAFAKTARVSSRLGRTGDDFTRPVNVPNRITRLLKDHEVSPASSVLIRPSQELHGKT